MEQISADIAHLVIKLVPSTAEHFLMGKPDHLLTETDAHHIVDNALMVAKVINARIEPYPLRNLPINMEDAYIGTSAIPSIELTPEQLEFAKMERQEYEKREAERVLRFINLILDGAKDHPMVKYIMDKIDAKTRPERPKTKPRKNASDETVHS